MVLDQIPYQINDPYIVALLPAGNVEFLHPSAKVLIDRHNSSTYPEEIDFTPYIQRTPFVELDQFHLSAPAIAFIEITNMCNLNCQHCYADSGKKRSNELSTEQILKLIDDFAEMGVLQLFLTGGEVFTHPDAIKIINHARTKPFSTQIFTNGLLINEKNLSRIPQGQSFFVSFDTAVPERTVRGRMDFPKLKKAFDLVHKYGHVLRTAVSVHNQNIDDIEEIFEWTKINGFSRPQWLETHPIGRALFNPHIIIKKEKVDKVFDIYQRCMDRYHSKPNGDPAPNDSKIRSLRTIKFCQQLENATNQEKCGRSVVYVNSQGVVYPCSNCMSNKSYAAGNIAQKTFGQIWEEGFKEFRKITFNDFEKCNNCSVFQEGIWCQFRCPPLSVNITGNELECGATEYLQLFMLKSNEYWKRKKLEGYKLSIV